MLKIEVIREKKEGKPYITVNGSLEGTKHELMTELVFGVQDICEQMGLDKIERSILLTSLNIALIDD